jgi:hypothetical protein
MTGEADRLSALPMSGFMTRRVHESLSELPWQKSRMQPMMGQTFALK